MSFNEKLSYTEHVVVSPTTDFAIGFVDYGLPSDTINVFVDDVLATEAGYTVTRKNNMVVELQPAVASGVVRLQRATNLDTSFYSFTAGAKFVAANIDANFNQILHSQQETRDGFDKLAGDVYPLVNGLEVALSKADEASKAAQEAADAAEEAAKITRSASQVTDESGLNQQEVNNLSGHARLLFKNYDDLRNYTGLGMRIFISSEWLRGSFIFDESDTSSVDNGGTIIVDSLGRRWKREFNGAVKAYWFGAPSGVNDQVQINKAIAYGTANKQVVDLTGCIWGINGTVYAHGHVQIVASFNSCINVNSVGDYPNLWAFEFGDPSQGWTGGRAITTIEGYLYLNCNSRANRLHGAYFKGSFHNIEHVRAYGFNGTGIKLESFHDSTFLRPTVEMCGNEVDYSFVCDSPDDTSNCFNIVSLQCEQAQQRGIYIVNTIRSTIQNVHAERLTVTNNSAVSNPLGKDYNHVMILSNSTVNQALFHANTGDINIRMDGSLSTYINVLAVGGRVCGEFGNKTTYTDLGCKYFIQAGVLLGTTFNSLDCDRATLLSDATLNNPKINYLDFQYQAKSINTFGGEVNTIGDTSTSTTITLGSINFFGTKIQNIYRTGFSDQNPPMLFNSCPITNLVGDYQNVAIVQNCFVKNANLANEFKPKFIETTIETLNPTGNVGYLTRGGSITTGTWSLPAVSYPQGTITERIGYDAAGKIYQNTVNGVSWVKIA